MPKFIMTERILDTDVVQARIGTGTKTASANNVYDDKETGKFCKLAGESMYSLCASGDQIEGRISSVEVGTYDDFSFGGVAITRYMGVTFDGTQANAGVSGTLAIGDYVLCGTIVARGTALTSAPKVIKATDQALAKSSPFAWRVVSLGTGAGAFGTTGLIERVGH